MKLPVPLAGALLSTEQTAALSELSASLNHAYRKRQMWRTETEMRISVLDDLHFPTPASKYWQCIREQSVFLEQLAQLTLDFRRNEVKRRKAQRLFDAGGDEIAKDEAQIELDECAWMETNMRLQAADRIREILLWETLKAEQIAADPTFDRDDVNAHQLVSYTTQFAIRAAQADATTMSAGELDNLIGLFSTSVRRAREMGVIDQVLAHLPTNAAEQVKLLP